MRKNAQHAREDRLERKGRVLTQGAPSLVQQIADAIVIKDGSAFCLSAPDGYVPLRPHHGYGLYYHDCRFLDGYELRLNGGAGPVPLVASAERGFSAVYELTNPDLHMAGNSLIPKDTIGIRWDRTITRNGPAQHESITFVNYNRFPVELDVELRFRCSFEDVLEVRGLLVEPGGELYPPVASKDLLHFDYCGRDGIFRAVDIHLFPEAAEVGDGSVRYHLHVEPERSGRIALSMYLSEGASRQEVESSPQKAPNIALIQKLLHKESNEWAGWVTQVETDNMLFDRVLERSVRDLHMLKSKLDGDTYFAAGLPWFGTLFGRDSLITAMQTLALQPSTAARTLRVLAARQGTRVDHWLDETPGKILHELRVGELTNIRDVPFSPYYGTVDATPLFLVLLGYYLEWTADEELWREMSPHAHRALEWMWTYGDSDKDGFLDYVSASDKGLINQGWKDSGNAMVNKDGTLAVPPIAPAEVQGYAYLAQILMSQVMHRMGQAADSADLARRAEKLKRQFNEAYWMPDADCYAMALQQGGKPCAVISSNAGQVLFGEIADPEKARQVARRIVQQDMFSGWGVRTLASREAAYNPLGYHLGTVWPHDNSLIASGLKKYSHDHEVTQIFDGIFGAAVHFRDYRLPELFCGFPRDQYGIPVNYLVACHPQAWAAGSIPLLLQTCLGLTPNAFEDELRIVRPSLPLWLNRLRLIGLRVGSSRVDLRFNRVGDKIDVDYTVTHGGLKVVVERPR